MSEFVVDEDLYRVAVDVLCKRPKRAKTTQDISYAALYRSMTESWNQFQVMDHTFSSEDRAILRQQLVEMVKTVETFDYTTFGNSIEQMIKTMVNNFDLYAAVS